MNPEPADRAYRLKRGESAADGLRRVARGRAEKAVARLRGAGPGDTADAIHGARKDLKKLRTVLRVVRADLGKRSFQTESGSFRDAGRQLSDSRDAEVKLATLKGLEERFGDELPPGPALSWERALSAEREAIDRRRRG